MREVLLFLFCFTSVAIADFKNPIFASQDPWITRVDGMYYYTQSGCGSASICVKISHNLTELGSVPWVDLWTAPSGAPNSHDVWAPEMHYVQGAWYIYYAADDGDNNNHRLFVLTSKKPTGPFVEADTGLPHGQLKESTGHWGIDPDVFIAADGKLYITWSCTNQANSAFPQRICLANMPTPVTMGPTSFLSTPTEYFETRDAAIQEGPVGYTQYNRTYITYSGSASWIPDDYAVGILALSENGNPLNPSDWEKVGPILDHHSTVYGPGSVVFTPSVDDTEYYVLYHAIEKLDCSPNAYACRDIRMQRMYFSESGFPILGYPVNPGVSLPSPSGEGGPKGSIQIGQYAPAWGDAAEGNPSAGTQQGKWTYNNSATTTSSLGGTWDQIFSPVNPNPESYTASVQVQHVETGKTISFPKYGFYCAFDDEDNHAEVFLDVNYNVMATHAEVAGADQGWQNTNFPSGFDPSQFHTLACSKQGSTFTFTLDGGHSQVRNFNINNGQVGLVVVDTIANYRSLSVN